MKQYIEKVIKGTDLTVEEMISATEACFHPDVTNTEISAFLTALRMKGVTASEISGLAEVIRTQSAIQPEGLSNIMDKCATRGAQPNIVNISTTAAFVIAGAGVPVAKHSNSHHSSKIGNTEY